MFRSQFDHDLRTVEGPDFGHIRLGMHVVAKLGTDSLDIWMMPKAWERDDIMLVAYLATVKDWIRHLRGIMAGMTYGHSRDVSGSHGCARRSSTPCAAHSPLLKAPPWVTPGSMYIHLFV
jgi:hypothetical protein